MLTPAQKKKRDAAANALRVKNHRARIKAGGQERLELFSRPEHFEAIRAFTKQLNEGA